MELQICLLYTSFHPSDFNADDLVRTLADAGFKGVVLTCKHHDGCLLYTSARELREEMPPMTVCVAEIARSVPFWLFFACELKKHVEELRGHGITRYCFTGRKECVLSLIHI